MSRQSQGHQQETTRPGSRAALLREALVFQLKLVADGLRDAALIPVSLVAALIGLIRGGDEADREFRQVLALGIQTERWINLFGYHRPSRETNPTGSMDAMINRVEEVLREQYESGKTTREAKDAIENALEPGNATSGGSDKSVDE